MARLQSKIFLIAAAILVQLLGILTFAVTLFAQELFWVNSPTGGAQGFGIALDSSENSYVTGTFNGTTTFAPGVALTAVNLNDLFVAKYDRSGTALWATSVGGVGPDAGRGIVVDGSGNSYVTGFRGGSDLFVAKYDSNGSQKWVKTVAGTDNDCSAIGQNSCLVGLAIAVDSSGNYSYVTGLFDGTVSFGPGVSDQLTSAGGTDIFVAKYDNSGTGSLVWAKRAGGTGGNDGGHAIAVDGLGNSYVTGVGAITPNNMFISKYDSNGSLVWAKRSTAMGTPGNVGCFQVGTGVALDGVGNIYVAGDYLHCPNIPLTIFGEGELPTVPNEEPPHRDGETVLTSAGDRDIFIAKYNNSDGKLVWAKRAAGGVGSEQARGIALDGSGNSYLTGTYSDSATFGPNEHLIAAGASDIFVTQFDSNGNFVWATSAGGSIDNPAQRDFGFGIAVNRYGNSYVTGRFQGTATDPATFGAEEPNETQLSGTAVLNMFIAKFAGDPDLDGKSNLVLNGFALDNCPTVPNSDQTDVNGDGFGDACVSPDVTIPSSSSFGANPIIEGGTSVGTGISIGDDAEIGSNVTLNRNITAGDDLIIGDGTSIDQGATFGDNVTLGANVVIGRNAVIGSGAVIGDNTVVGQAANIGANAQVGSNVRVGTSATVATGAVVPNGTIIGAKRSFP
jgi:acetyltransferase-like isoleucine patch superfamily enzyme